MADTAPNRPRPRPRPKARSPVNGDVPSSLSAAGPSSTPCEKKAIRNEADLDAMFMKNRNRSTKTWEILEEIKKDDTDALDLGSDSESDDNASPRSRKRVRRRVEALPKPKWQKDKELLRLLSAEPSDDSDSDVVELTDSHTTPNGTKRDGKRKRRSRSRSITPPPQIPQQQVDNVKKFVRQALGETTISYDFDISTDTVVFDPEIAKILQHARQGTSSQLPTSSTPNNINGDDEVHITVNWKPHPLDTKGEDARWKYQVSRNDNFRDLFEAIAEDATIRVDNLVICCEGKRIFASVNPNALNIWRDAEFTAYTKQAFEYIRGHSDLNASSGLNNTQAQNQDPPSPSTAVSTTFEISDSEDGRPHHPLPPKSIGSGGYSRSRRTAAGGESQSEAENDDEDDDKFKLTLRSALTGSKDIVLTVRPTTKCGNILRAFLKKAGLEAQYPEVFAGSSAPVPMSGPAKGKKGGRKGKAAAVAPAVAVKDPRLCVDGDKLNNDSPISEADVEDGDLVEIVGL